MQPALKHTHISVVILAVDTTQVFSASSVILPWLASMKLSAQPINL